MRSMSTKLISGFLITTFVASTAFFALPQRSFAQEGGEDVTSQAEGGEDVVADTPAEAGTGVGVKVNANTGSATGDLLVQCGIKAAQDWLIDWALGQIGALKSTAPVPSVDDAAGAQKVRATVKGCITAIMNTLMKVAFAKFKKRLLDRLTDDVVGWISGKTGKPKFVTDFNSVLRDTADAAAGDTLQALGAGKLCDAKLSVQLQLNLQSTATRFSDNVSCTLSKVVSNVKAFGDNFQNGSWIAYQELNSMQNNKYGLQLLAFDELAKNQSKKTDALKAEVGGTAGFLSTKMCIKWSVIGKPQLEDGSMGPDIVLGTFLAGNDDALIDPNKPPAAPPAAAAALIERDYPTSKITRIECKREDQKITTPGQTLANVLGNSFQNDSNALVNATDLTPYLSKIFDAAFNRLIKEGVRGLSDASKNIFSESSRGVSTPYSTSSPSGYVSPLGTSTIAQLRASASTTLASANGKLSQINTKLTALVKTGTDLTTALQSLSNCQLNKTGRTCTTTATLTTSVKQVTDKLDSTSALISSTQASLTADAAKLLNPNITMGDLILVVADIQSLNTSLDALLISLATYETQLNAFNLTAVTEDLNRCNTYVAGSTPAYSCPL